MTEFSQTSKEKLGLTSASLEAIISDAIKKVGGGKENDLCKYIPVDSGGYIHHFTLRKMKSEDPQKLAKMIEDFIIQVDNPVSVIPKARAPRGSRKQKGQLVFTKTELEKMLTIAKEMGYQDIVHKLTPKKPLSTCKKELINSIKQNKVNAELWTAYAEAIGAYNDVNSSLQSNLDSLSRFSASQGLESLNPFSALLGNRR